LDQNEGRSQFHCTLLIRVSEPVLILPNASHSRQRSFPSHQ
jgi:hypothetical protein